MHFLFSEFFQSMVQTQPQIFHHIAVLCDVGARNGHRGAPLCCLECGFLRREVTKLGLKGGGKYLYWSLFHPHLLPDFL